MNESASGGFSSGSNAAADAPTPEQAAILQYLGLAPAGAMTPAQAGALISQSEADPAGREKLQSWHREKYRLHPDLFAPPQRSFREARWWQARISDDSLYGYSFRQPSVNQTLVILEALDRREPGWDREGSQRREARFMNELATLSPELCKPGCTFPHDLPIDDRSEAPAAAPAIRAPSAPFVPNLYAATSSPSFTPPSQPAWNPPVQPPTQFQKSDEAEKKSRGSGKWLLLLCVLVAGVGGYFYLRSHATVPERDGDGASAAPAGTPTASQTKPSPVFAPLSAVESRQRAIAKHPDLGKAGTPLNLKFVAAFHRLEVERSLRLQQADWPERLADECAGVSPPSPTAPKNTPTSLAPIIKPQAADPLLFIAPAVAVATSPATPAAGAMFVSLEADYKNKENTVKYHQHGASQEAGVFVKVRSMMRSDVKFVVRCVFFKRPTGRGDLRVVLSKDEKRFDLSPGQTYSDTFDSPPVYRGRGATEEFDGWLVQLIPEGSDKFLKQIGSTGTIEELGKTMKF